MATDLFQGVVVLEPLLGLGAVHIGLVKGRGHEEWLLAFYKFKFRI